MEYIANAADCGKFREVFEDAARKQITTRSPEKLLKWLEATDFYTAPASTRFHGAYEGGLCVHSVNVFRRLSQMRNHTDAIKDIETAAVCGLFHDVCKANFYKTEYRNVKNEQTGKWEKAPYYTVEDSFPFGHGEKSVYLISKHFPLTDEEAVAIRWHMGAYDEAAKGGSFAQTQAFEQFPLAMYLHFADMEATQRPSICD